MGLEGCNSAIWHCWSALGTPLFSHSHLQYGATPGLSHNAVIQLTCMLLLCGSSKANLPVPFSELHAIRLYQRCQVTLQSHAWFAEGFDLISSAKIKSVSLLNP